MCLSPLCLKSCTHLGGKGGGIKCIMARAIEAGVGKKVSRLVNRALGSLITCSRDTTPHFTPRVFFFPKIVSIIVSLSE